MSADLSAPISLLPSGDALAGGAAQFEVAPTSFKHLLAFLADAITRYSSCARLRDGTGEEREALLAVGVRA